MPFSTKIPSNSREYIAFSISIGSAFVLLCLVVIHFLSKHVLLIIFRLVFYYHYHYYYHRHILQECGIGGFCVIAHSPHFFFYLSPFCVIEHLRHIYAVITDYIENARPKIDEAEHLFVTKTGKALLVRNIRSTIDRNFKLAGVVGAKVNDLRHTFVAHHLVSGVIITRISKIAGHKRISTTERYTQYIEVPEQAEKTELGIL